MAQTRVLLVDDHPVVRKGIHDLLNEAAGIAVVGEASHGAEALQLVEQLSPDVLLLDMELPDMPGNQVISKLKARGVTVTVLALSAYADREYITESLAHGAAGYLVKDEVPENIIEAIRGVARGEQGWVSRQVAAHLSTWMQEKEAGKTKLLTPREIEVLRQVVGGKTNQEIAFALGISEKTVEKHLEGVFARLGVTSRVEAAVHAVREGWL
jgi:DNA-binding NarL/FixJ family response regulator